MALAGLTVIEAVVIDDDDWRGKRAAQLAQLHQREDGEELVHGAQAAGQEHEAGALRRVLPHASIGQRHLQRSAARRTTRDGTGVAKAHEAMPIASVYIYASTLKEREMGNASQLDVQLPCSATPAL